MRQSPTAARRPRAPPRGRPDVPPPVPTVSADAPVHPPEPAETSEDDDEAIRRMIEAAYT